MARRVLAALVFLGLSLDAAPLSYPLDRDAAVTVVIEDASGRRVRNLVSEALRQAGTVTEVWDGRDDNGQPVAPGDYRWRGLVHQAIESRYVGSFCSPHSDGETPWKHLDAEGVRTHEGGSGGGWLSDHAPPSVALAVGDEVLLGCSVAEEGDSLIRVTADFQKVWGARWQALVGPKALAFDPSDCALYIAGEGGWVGKDRLVVVRRLFKDGKIANYPVPKDVRARLDKENPAFSDQQLIRLSRKDYSGLVGMSVIGRYLVLALADRGRLALFDTKTALFVREIPLSKPTALCGEYALSDGNVVKIDVNTGKVATLFEACPRGRGLTRDAQGCFYVSDGAEHCVKVFSSAGRFLRRIGKSGGRREGTYDPAAMENPSGLAIDVKNRLWVTENSQYPRRVSIWTTDGGLVREFVGGARYGGGGSISGGKGYYGGMRFKLVEAPRQAELEAVLFRPDAHPGFPFDLGKHFLGPDLHQTVTFGGRRYLLADDGWGRRVTLVAEESGDRAVPRAAWGSADALTNELKSAKGVFLWRDANGDGKCQPDEMKVVGGYSYGAQWALRSAPTLDAFFKNRRSDGLWEMIRVKAQPGSPVPVWDFDAPLAYPVARTPHDEIIGTSPNGTSDEILVNLKGPHGGDFTNNVYLCVAPGGKVRWSYPNPYPTNGFTSPVPKRGEIRHTLNAEGFAEVTGFGGVWLLNGNFGTRYLLSTDGLFISELFTDQRVSDTFYQISEAPRGCVLSGHSAIGECFYGWLGNGADGRVLQIIGKQTCNVCELTGLQTLKRLKGGRITLKERATPLSMLPRRETSVIGVIEMGGNWMPGGEQWYLNAPNVLEDEKRLARFAVGSGGGRSFVLQIRVEDETPFVNNGSDFTTLFHTGDAVDIRLALDARADPKRRHPVPGDIRYLVAPDPADTKKARVVKYTYVDPSVRAKPVVFASPVGMCEVARVEELENCGTRVVRDAKGYTLSVAIPSRHLPLARDEKLSGRHLMDVGVIFGDETGGEAKRREYFFDDESRIVYDIPSEAGVNPSKWGPVEFCR